MTAYSGSTRPSATTNTKYQTQPVPEPRTPNQPDMNPGPPTPSCPLLLRALCISPLPLPLPFPFPNLWFDLSCVPVPWTSCCRREAQTRTSTCSSRVQRSLSRVQRPSSTGGSRRRGRYSCSEHHSGSFFSYCTAPTLFEYLDNVQMDRHRVRVSKPYCKFFFLSFVAL